MQSIIRSGHGALAVLVALTLLLTPSSLFAASFTDGLIVYLPFDEGNGDVAKDLSGNEHDGKIDKPEWVKGKFEKALKFKGANSGTFVTVESTPKLNVNTMTFMAWVNADTWDGTRQIVGKSVHGGCGGRVQYGVFSEGGVFKVRFATDPASADISTGLPKTKDWLHVAVTNDGKVGKIFFDGKEAVEGKVSGKLKVNEDPWRVGQDCQRENYIFAGIIDDVRLWDRALSEKEINTYKEQGAEALAVDPRGKLPTAWGQIKRQY